MVILGAKLVKIDYFCNMNHDPLDKKYYKIRDVVEMLDIPAPTLRFWEKEFPRLKPRRNEGKTRFYTREDIELLRKIKYLVKDKGLKIAAARQSLATKGDDVDKRVRVIERLTSIKTQLEGLSDALSGRSKE